MSAGKQIPTKKKLKTNETKDWLKNKHNLNE